MQKHFLLVPFFIAFVAVGSMAQGSSSLKTKLGAWYGNWEGIFEIYTLEGRKDSLTMNLTIGSSGVEDTLIWNTSFVQGERVIEKPYKLYESEEPNVFVLDEGNTIDIPQYLLGNEIISFYAVMGSKYWVSYRILDKERMLFAIGVIPEEEGTKSGGEGEIPIVESFKIRMTQTAILNKKK